MDTSKRETWNRIQETLVECALELFETAALAPSPLERWAGEVSLVGTSVVATIGYAGNGIKGALMLLASREVAAGITRDTRVATPAAPPPPLNEGEMLLF